ncbi:hypothetical protein AArcCO_0737 [Halalkaliarchaeum sp. AArc-CO]|uniref:hypothetical protein n=1 Tax=unclassified Halalkaliarchaeum TaxID=2678344 RepID=UPI00217E4554|nr:MULTISPECIES: hypothetical protein [unclassified Halalkaliarchaeum]MDR5672320.1 hypothetical protein [Halalkaliarchaeum sp. AArc-GB]UWG50058.1 hypothetical protein AArcCO_0737 [Halalkaliarchaeum sp. AArc-CO]
MADLLLDRDPESQSLPPTEFIIFHDGDPDDPIASLHDEEMMVPREGSEITLSELLIYDPEPDSDTERAGERTEELGTFLVVDVNYEYILTKFFEAEEDEAEDGADATKLLSAALVEVSETEDA